MWNLRSKTKEQTKQKQTHKYREQTDSCQRGGTREDRQMVRELARCKLPVINKSQEYNICIGNRVNNILTIFHGDRL